MTVSMTPVCVDREKRREELEAVKVEIAALEARAEELIQRALGLIQRSEGKVPWLVRMTAQRSEWTAGLRDMRNALELTLARNRSEDMLAQIVEKNGSLVTRPTPEAAPLPPGQDPDENVLSSPNGTGARKCTNDRNRDYARGIANTTQ